jgi:hypothetical protein
VKTMLREIDVDGDKQVDAAAASATLFALIEY